MQDRRGLEFHGKLCSWLFYHTRRVKDEGFLWVLNYCSKKKSMKRENYSAAERDKHSPLKNKRKQNSKYFTVLKQEQKQSLWQWMWGLTQTKPVCEK